MISYLCKVKCITFWVCINTFSSESKDLRKSREDKDILSKENVLKLLTLKDVERCKTNKNVLKDRFNIIYNLKAYRRESLEKIWE